MQSVKILTVYIFLSAMFFVGCAQENSENTITVTQLNKSMVTDSNLIILDVRNPDELIGPLGQIEGVVNIPLSELESNLSKLEKFKDKNIAVICRSGRRSGIATELLIKEGFSAKNVLGGMIEYRK